MSEKSRHHKSESSRKDKKISRRSSEPIKLMNTELEEISSNLLNEETKPILTKFKFKQKPEFIPRTVKTNDFPLSVNPEYDSLNSNSMKSNFDQSYWETEVLRLHPEILDIINRVDPVNRASVLAGLFLPDRRLHSQKSILSLILQHLELLGLYETATALQESFCFEIEHPQHHPISQLIYHLERGLINADKFYSLLLPTPSFPTIKKDIEKQIQSHKNALGLSNIKNKDSTPIYEEDLLILESVNVDEKTQMPSTGTMNQLVWAASRRYRNFNPQFIDVFAMAYHTFMSSHLTLEKLKESWIMLEKVLDSKDRDRSELMFVALVEKWIETSFFDFDSMLIQNLFNWINELKTSKPAPQKRLMTSFQKQIKGKQSDQVIEINFQDVKIPNNLFFKNFEIIDMDIDEFSRQLTMYAGKFYYSLTAKELLDCAWSKPSIRHRAPNVVALTNHFNCLNQFIQHKILFSNSIEKRIEYYKYFTQLAGKLWANQDFFNGMAIATAFQANNLYRLKNHVQYLGELMDPINNIMNDAKSEKNFLALRTKHDEAPFNGGGQCIPYVGLYLTQLTFFYDGNADYIESLVNFSKCVGIFQLIDKILSFQKKEFTYVIIEQVQQKIFEMKLWDSSILSERSIQIEPNQLTFEEFEVMIKEGK